MSTEQQYKFIGGPLHDEIRPRPTMGRVPTAIDAEGAVIRVDKADQAIGRMARLGPGSAFYLFIGTADGEPKFAWIISASLLHQGGAQIGRAPCRERLCQYV